MKLFVRSILFAGILALVADSSMVAQAGNSGLEQRYRAKYGRPSPTEEARLQSSQVNAVSQEAMLVPVAGSANSGFEQWYRAKYGRPSPSEEARLNTLQINSAVAQAAPPTEEAGVVQTPAMESLSKDQLSTLIATAKTPAEHERIAKFYQSQAQYYLSLSKEHTAMLAAYKSNLGLTNNKNQASTIGHCDHFVQEFKALAAKSNELAQSHERMATDAANM